METKRFPKTWKRRERFEPDLAFDVLVTLAFLVAVVSYFLS